MPATARPTYSHSHAGGQAGARPKLYNPRHPERTLLYQTIAEHFEIWHELASAGQVDGQGDHHPPKPYVRQAFRKYLECGIFAHGFARAWCDDCGHDYFVAYSCKGRGVCPSCNTRRMVETAAHLTDHVFPRLPVRQWVLSVPKRLRYFMQRDGGVLHMVLRIFLRVISQSLQSNCPSAAQVIRAALHIGAVAFIHRFGSSLNSHVHFHVCVVDGVFEEVVAADVYSVAPHTGRGGWTWYTGAAGWMHRAGMESILGIRREGQILVVDPSIPAEWPGFEARIVLGDACYTIKVPPDGTQGMDETYATLDGTPLPCDGGALRFVMSAGEHTLTIALKKR